MSFPKYEPTVSGYIAHWFGEDQFEALTIYRASAELNRLSADSRRLDWWFECNEKERGHVMALVHMKGLSKRDAIDQVMNATKGAK